MKKRVISMILTAVLLCSAAFSSACFAQEDNSIAEPVRVAQSEKTPFEKYGALRVKGSKLLSEDGTQCQLHGVSTHGIAWFPEYVNKSAFRNLRDQWGVDTIRLAMYTAEYNG